MAVGKIWVLAETTDAGPVPATLELLTAARALGSSTEAVAWGSDVASVAGVLGQYGATTVYDVGDLAGGLPGPAVASAVAAKVAAGEGPDAILVPATYDGRDVAGRLSAKGATPSARWSGSCAPARRSPYLRNRSRLPECRTRPISGSPMISSVLSAAAISFSRSIPVSNPSSWHMKTASSVQILPAART